MYESVGAARLPWNASSLRKKGLATERLNNEHNSSRPCPFGPPFGPTKYPRLGLPKNVSSGMPEHDSWDEGRLPRSGTLVCLIILTQKQLKSATADRKSWNILAVALTETASPCCRVDMGNLVEFLSSRQVAEPAYLRLVSQISILDLSGIVAPAVNLNSRQHSSRGQRGTHYANSCATTRQ